MVIPYQADNTLLIIRSLVGLGGSGTTSHIGHTIEDLAVAFAADWPLSTLTESDIAALVAYHSARGVFLLGGFAAGSAYSYYYYVNGGMGGANPINQWFVNATTATDPTQASPGYLPCNYDTWGQSDPYAVSTSTGAKAMGRNAVKAGTGTSGNVGLPSSC